MTIRIPITAIACRGVRGSSADGVCRFRAGWAAWRPNSRSARKRGPLLETFVFSEVLKQASWFGKSCALYHYRDKDQDEVDLVIGTGSGASVGIRGQGERYRECW
jgi:predicted AAA+ superfamily ATPase